MAGGGTSAENGNEGLAGADKGEFPTTLPMGGDNFEADVTEDTNATYPFPLEADVGGEMEPPCENSNVASNVNKKQPSECKPLLF